METGTGDENRRDIRIGVDVGGTFTDLIVSSDDGALHVTKVPSTPSDPGAGVLNALHQAAHELGTETAALLSRCALFVHGSTVATNTILERKGATVGLITSLGFRDTLEIRRGIREDPWDHRSPYAPVLVPRHRRLAVDGRLDSEGHELAPAGNEDLDSILHTFQACGVDSVAICLLHSYANPAHERHYAAELAKCDGAPSWLCVSHDVVPVLGEYERSATTVLNAYIAPRVAGYLQSLDARLQQLGLVRPMLLIQNNGGSISSAQVAARPVTLLLSGPAAGVGALEVAREATGHDHLLSLEIGGTSADVMLMQDGEVPVSDRLSVGGYDAALPSVDIHTIGAGGGTIARVDDAGLLEVGPAGAGAVPGPAAYGLGGTAPTVTDALLLLGRLREGSYAGGSVVLDARLAHDAVERHIATPLSIPVEDAATGIVRLLEQNVLQAVETMTFERGVDPRDFLLVPAGGAGPMHGASIARRLGCAGVYVPRLSGAFCALGMLNVDVRHDLMRSWLRPLDPGSVAELAACIDALSDQAREQLHADGFEDTSIRLRPALDLRYIGQQWSLRIAVEPAEDIARIRGRFERTHESRYRHTQPGGEVEITAVHLAAHGRLPRLIPPRPPPASSPAAPASTRQMYFDDVHGWVLADVYDGAGLTNGHRLTGPAIIEERTTTLCIGPGDELEVDAHGNYRVSVSQ